MFPSFQGSQGDAHATELNERSPGGSSPFHRYDNDDESDRERISPFQDHPPTAVRAAPGSPSQASVGQNFSANLGPLEGYWTGGVDRVMSLAADATLGAQVARVRVGLDAKVRKACEAPIFTQLGLETITSGIANRTAGSAVETLAAAALPAQGDVSQAEHENLCVMIQRSKDAQAHLEAVLGALEDYQKHRQGLADAEQRLALALQEAGQREQGAYGEALATCGKAHQQAAAKRLEAHAAEELHVVSKLRAHYGKAGADVKRTTRRYEAAWQELQVIRRARTEAQRLKQAASGDSLLAPTVEGNAATTETVKVHLLRAEADSVKGKLSMFEAKHATDYGVSMGAHMECLVAEQSNISQFYVAAQSAAETVKASKAASVELEAS